MNNLGSLKQRFFAKVERLDDNRCWPWLAYKNADGYGVISGGGAARNLKAHRVSWIIHFGEIPEGKQVNHKCDNRDCVNPSHLWLGTQLENIKDCLSKQRHAFGARHPKAKLRPEDVIAIRADSRSSYVLAKEYKIHTHSVELIKQRKNWKHLPETI